MVIHILSHHTRGSACGQIRVQLALFKLFFNRRLHVTCKPHQLSIGPYNIIINNHTLNRTLEGIGLAGSVNSFSTPPVSFQCMSRLVGGAKSSVVTMSDVLLSWFFISSPDMFFTSSTISLRLRFVLVIPAETTLV